MTDDEILQSVGLDHLLGDAYLMLIRGQVLKAMGKARKDERIWAQRDIDAAIVKGQLPRSCELAGHFIVYGDLPSWVKNTTPAL